METTIRKLTAQDTNNILEMMRTFYASPAVFSNGSDEIFLNDIQTCLANSPYLEGYVLENSQEIQGYAMVAKSFSTEFGKPCIWIEDLYMKDRCRGTGLGSAFLRYMEETYPKAVFRLEVEEENEGAVKLYRKHGYDVLPYMEMKR